MPTASDRPDNMLHSVEALLRLIEARDAEVALLKLMVQKLKLQLARRNRAQFGASSERFEDAQGSLIEPHRVSRRPVGLSQTGTA